MINGNGEDFGKEEVTILKRDGSLWAKARWFWLRRTGLERVLLVLLFITLVALIVCMVFALINKQERLESRIGELTNSSLHIYLYSRLGPTLSINV